MSAEPIERSEAVRGGMFKVRLFEAGSGRPLLYLHGAEGLLGGWQPFLSQLASRFQVIAPEHPGFGESSGVEQLDDVLDLIVYYLDLLDALGLERPHLIGHDLGGMIAAELAALAGARVGRLVLVAPLGLWIDETPVLDFFVVGRQELVAASWHEPASAPARRVLAPPLAEEEQRLAALQRTQNLAAAARFLWPIPDRGLEKRLHRITPPTLLVWGADDRVVPPIYGQHFKAKLPDARLEVLSDCGHHPMLERPEAFVQAVVPFLTA